MDAEHTDTDDDGGIAGVDHELTMHLERAQELARRAQRANGAAQMSIDRAREIANELCDRARSAMRSVLAPRASDDLE